MYHCQLHGGDHRQHQRDRTRNRCWHPGTPARYLVNTANAAQGVAYSLYSDSGYNNVIANNAALPVASTAGGVNSYTLYGRITGGGNSVTVVPGTYTDTINVSVTY